MPVARLPLLLFASALAWPALAAVGFDAIVLRTGFEDAVCPDGQPEDAETCDDGGSADGDGCSASCRIEFGHYCAGAPSVCVTFCGDGAPAGTEGCDDSAASDGDGCSSQCMVEEGFQCSGAPSVCATICGDGVIAGGESCDDDGTSDGDGCSSQCMVEEGFQCSGAPSVCTGICGDGIITGGESCDDANSSACGTCDATCSVLQSATATGHIVATAASELADGETFAIHDGFQAATFEFDFDLATQAGSTAVPLSPSASAGMVGDAIGAAIGTSPLLVQAGTSGSALVQLVHARATSLGNQPIVDTVAAAGFQTSGMAGGAGGDCPAGVGCTVGDDCASGACSQGVCVEP